MEGVKNKSVARLCPAGVGSQCGRKSHHHIEKDHSDQALRKDLKETRTKEFGPQPQNGQNGNNDDQILRGTRYITDTAPSILHTSTHSIFTHCHWIGTITPSFYR